MWFSYSLSYFFISVWEPLYSARPKKKLHTNISLDRLYLRLWHAFVMALFRYASAISAKFISIQSCIHFLPGSCSVGGRVGPLCKVFSSTSQRFSKGIMVWINPCVKMMSYAPWTTLSQFEPNWHGHLGICPCQKSTDVITWSFSIFR